MKHAVTILLLLIFTTLPTSSNIAGTCPKGAEEFAIEFFGTYQRKGQQFSDIFTYKGLKETSVSHQLTFQNGDFNTLIIRLNKLPSIAGLLTNKQYTVTHEGAKQIGGFFQTLTVKDATGVVFSITNASNNRSLGIQSSNAIISGCPASRTGGYPAKVTLKANGKTVFYGYMGQKKIVSINGTKYSLRIIGSYIYKSNPRITREGKAQSVSYIISR